MNTLSNGMAVGHNVHISPLGSHPELVPVSQSFGIRPDQLRDRTLAELDAPFHHQQLCYLIPQAHRAVAFALDYPDLTLTGFGALALYGLPFLGDGCDTALVDKAAARTLKAAPRQPQVFRRGLQKQEKWKVSYQGKELSIASPPVATVHALKDLRSETCGWPVVACGGLSPSLIRAVQLIDATRRHLAIDPLHVLAASYNRLSLPWITEALIHSSALADSPKETEMRLITKTLADKHGLILEEQVPVTENGRIITRFDLALFDPFSGLKFGLMYDGIHHWEYQQRQKDAQINIEVTMHGWIALRFSSAALSTMYERMDSYLTRMLAQRTA